MDTDVPGEALVIDNRLSEANGLVGHLIDGPVTVTELIETVGSTKTSHTSTENDNAGILVQVASALPTTRASETARAVQVAHQVEAEEDDHAQDHVPLAEKRSPTLCLEHPSTLL